MKRIIYTGVVVTFTALLLAAQLIYFSTSSDNNSQDNLTPTTTLSTESTEHKNLEAVSKDANNNLAPSTSLTGVSQLGRDKDNNKKYKDRIPTNIPSAISTSDALSCNALSNDEFDNGTADWWIHSQTGSSASFSIDNTSQLSGTNSAYIDISQASGVAWHIEFAQEPLSVTNGTLYDFSFEAKAASPRDIYVVLQLRESPWTSYWAQTVSLTTTAQTFNFTNLDLGVTSSNIGYMFKLGTSTHNVWIDNVFLTGNCSCDDLTNAGQIGYDQNNCSSFNPTSIQNITSPSGGSGAVEYVWMKTTTGCSSAPTGITDPNWSVISGALGATYDPGSISTTTCYARLARRAGCTSYLASNVVTMEVSSDLGGVLVSSSNVSCHKGHNGQFTVQGTGGVPPYEYKTNGTTWTSNNTFTGLHNGVYMVDIRDANGCTAWNTLSVDITEPSSHLYCQILEVNHANCAATPSGSITVTGINAVPPYSYSLNGGAFVSNGTFTGLSAGDYTITVKDSEGCEFVCSTATVENQISVCYGGEIDQPTMSCPSNNASILGNLETPYSICNIIENHEFDVSGEWEIWANAGNSASFSYDNTSQLSGVNSAYVDITSSSGTDWHIVLFQRSIELVSGTQYEIRLDVKGEANKTINVTLQQDNAPNTTYYSESFAISTTGETYVLPTFTPSVSDDNVKILIRVGDSSDNLWIDNVVMGVKNTSETPSYQWQRSEKNSSGNWSNWIDISGATSGTYDPPAATVDTRYRRQSSLPSCSNWESSNVIEVPVCPLDLSGRVFEDINYGGGDGRNYTESNTSAQGSGWSNNEIGVANAIVELYDNAGNYISNTTTDPNGNYTFTALVDGNYQVRVVNGSFDSNRGSNSTGETIIPVQTFRSTNTQNFVSEIGGADPSLSDASANTSSSPLSSLTSGSNIAQSVTSISVAGSNVAGVDFGYNFNTIVNTNNSGQGSVRQFIINSNELENDNLDQEDAPTNGVSFPKDLESETSIFMIPGSGVHTINPSSGLDAIEDPQTHLTGYTQQGSSQGSIASRTITIELEGNTVLYDGVTIYSSDVQLSGLSIHSFRKGIRSYKNNTTGNFIWGNYIGAESDGLTIGTNSSAGIELNNVNDSYIGTNADNVNDANEGNLAVDSYGGIEIKSTSGVLVAGNYVGTDKNGTGDLGNTFIGIHIVNADGANVIGFDDNATSNNADHMRNVSSGNGTDGIRISGGDNQVVAGNYLGTDVTGTSSIPNGGYGFQLITNVNNLILGTDSDGDDDVKERNIISGNNAGLRFVGYGVGDGNRISGNFIGTDVTGNTALQNDNNGIDISGDWTNVVIGTNGDNVNDGVEGNVISGNGEDGIRLADTDGALIAGNNIGVGYNSTSNVGNGKRGILIAGSAANNIVGYSPSLVNQDELIVGNYIKYNDDAGIGLSGNGTQNRISRNQSNSNDALGIDLDYDLVTANDNGDTDSGPNDLLNFPVLENATIIGSDLVITGFAPANSEIEFFITDGGTNPDPRPSYYTKDFGEGAEYLFSAFEGGASDSDASTGSYTDDGTGATSTKTQNKFKISVPAAGFNLVDGLEITATATNSSNSTSEFSGWVEFYTCDINLGCELVGQSVNNSCHKSHDGEFTITGINGTAPYEYSLDGGNTWTTYNTFTNLSAATYTVDVRDANGCEAFGCTVVVITEPAWYLGCSQVGNTNHVSCGGSNDGSFTVLGNNGTPPYMYSLNGGTFVTSGTFTGLASGTYDVTVKDANDCTVDCQSIIVSQPTTACYPGEIDEPIIECPANDPGTIGNAESPYTVCNMLFNSEFDDSDNLWALFVEGSNTASLSIDNTSQLSGANSAYVDITSTTGTFWHIQLYQNPLTLVNGTQYELSFEAKSVAPRTVRAVLELGEAPWTEYWTETINLTTTAQTFTFSGINPGVNNSNVTFFIKGGESSENFWVDNIVFGEKSIASNVSFQWQKRENDGAGGWTVWSDISGATSETYDPPIQDNHYQYRRMSNIPACNENIPSNIIQVDACPCEVTTNGDETICVGESIPLTTTSTGIGTLDYAWSPTTGLSDANIANPIANPTTTTTYSVTVTDDIGCQDIANLTVSVLDTTVIYCERYRFKPDGTEWADNPWIPITDCSIELCIVDGLGDLQFDGGPNHNTGWVWTDESGNVDAEVDELVVFANIGTNDAGIYTGQYTNANGCISNLSFEVIVHETPIATASNDGPITCSQSIATLSALPAGMTYEWTGPNNFNSTQENPTATEAGVYTVVIIDGNGCPDTATTELILDNTPPVADAGANQDICADEVPVTIGASSLTGHTYQWSTGGSDIAGATNSTLDVSPTVTTDYTLTVTGPNGCTATSDVNVNVKIQPTDAGAISGDESQCGSYDPSTITSSAPATGHSGATIAYRWLSSEYDCGTETWSDFTIIAGATSETYDPSTINVTTKYKRSTGIETCTGWLGSNEIIKEVIEEITDGGQIESAETMCGSFDPAEITSVTDPSGGCGGTMEYRWYMWEKDCNTGNWITPATRISGADQLSYDPPTITVSTRYRRYARRSSLCPGTNGTWLVSNFIIKTVEENVTVLGSITGDEDSCGAFDPSSISFSTPPSGGCEADIDYRWFKQTQDCATGDFGTWEEIATGIGVDTYDPTNITITTRYGVHVRRGSCDWQVVQTLVTKTVHEDITDPGILTGDESNCVGFDPDEITGTAASGGCISQTRQYQWQSREGTTGTFNNITGETGENYDPAAITTTTQYRRAVRYINCPWSYSNEVTKTILGEPVVTLTLGQNELCSHDGIITLTGGTPANGEYDGPGVTDGDFDPLVAGIGTHTISYTFVDGNGCTAIAYDDIEVFALSSVSLSLNEYVACVTSTSLSLSGGSPSGGNYSGTGVDPNTNTFNPSSAGVGAHLITYTYTDGNSCTVQAQQYIIVNSLPEVTLDDATICSGDTISLNPLVCESYVDIIAQRPLLTPGWSNVFGVGGTGIKGDGELCWTLDDAHLTSANMIGLNTDPHTNNNYTSMDFAVYVLVRHEHAKPYLMQIREDGTSMANPYNSTTSYVGSTFCIRRTGTTIEYLLDGVVEYTSTKSSTGTLYYDHSIHSAGGIYTGGYSKFNDISLCGDLDYNYDWSNGDTTDSIAVHTAGTYSVQITDNNGCIQSEQSEVTVNTISNPSVSVDGPIRCDDTEVQLTATPSGLSYTWSGPDNFTSTSRTPSVSVPGTYEVTIHDSNISCNEVLSVDVALESEGAITAVNVGCADEDITVDYTIAGSETQAWIGLYEVAGAQGAFIDWDWVPTIPGSGTVTFSDHTLTGGTYEARLYSTSGFILCESEPFNLNPTPVVSLSSDGGFTCEDDAVKLTASPSNMMYLWNGPNGFVSSSMTPDVYIPGEYTITVTDPATLCESLDTIEVILESAGSIDQITTSCNNDVIEVDYTIAGSEAQAWIGLYEVGSGQGTFLDWDWVPTIPGSGTIYFTDHPLTTGDYEARLYSTAGFILCETEPFTYGQTPECLVTGRSQVQEYTQSEIYSAPGGMSYSWSIISGDATIDGTTNGINVNVDFGSSNSTLELTITSPQGCSSTCSIDIEMTPAGECNFRDEFILQAFDNSDGTESWSSTPWIENGDDGNPVTGDIVFVSQAVRLDNDDSTQPSIERAVDLSTIANATLTFNYNQGSGELESSDIVQVHVYDGTSWHVVLSDTGTIPPNSAPTIDISQHANENTKIRIAITSGYTDASEFVFFDNVTISGDCIVPEICDDGIDNDFDGLTDCEDPDCSSFVDCVCQTIITNRHIYYKTRTTP